MTAVCLRPIAAYNELTFRSQGDCMSRMSVLLSLALLLTPFADAKDKNKIVLPADVLNAQTALVVIRPDAGEPLTNPTANRTAREDVEKALLKWGRFRFVLESQAADLVFAVRKGTGRSTGPTIKGGPIDNRPVILQPTEGGIRIGGQRGQPPGSQPGTGTTPDTGPRLGTEMGPSEDMLEVYRGGVESPLDGAPVWRYVAKDALRSPAVPAVEQFQKAIDEAQKAAAQKQQKKP
jgi:hypothetical protein